MVQKRENRKLGEACDFITPGVEEFRGTRKYVATADVNYDQIMNSVDITYTERPSRANVEVRESDVLVAKMAQTQKFLVATKDHSENYIFSTGFALLRTKSDLIPKYLFYFLTTKEFNKQKDQLATGATQKAINNSSLKNFEIPLLSIDIQKQIVERLDKIAEAQKLNDELIQKSDELFQSLLHQKLNPAGKDWGVKKLGDKNVVEIIDGDRGKNYPPKNEFQKSGYCLFLNTKNVTQAGFIFNETDFIPKERDEKLRKGKLQKNDVVLTTRGTVGNSALYDDSVEFNHIRINSGMVVLRSNIKEIMPKFLWIVLSSKPVLRQFKQILSGTAQPQLPINNLVKIKIPLPPLEVQKQIVAKLSAVQEYKTQLLAQKSKLKELFDSALGKSFSRNLIK